MKCRNVDGESFKMWRVFVFIALISIFQSCSKNYRGELIFVEPDNSSAFNYPYFLFLPENVLNDTSLFFVVEPNNSGFADDDFEKHIEKAKRIATKDFYIGNYVARNLRMPLIVPVFPRTKKDWWMYTHALDRDVMSQKETGFERIDIQLIEMFKDARLRLKDRNVTIKDKFLLTGFSASGTFANRFTLLHPECVLSVAAGGVNGLLMLPVDSIQGEKMEYPLGTSDFKELLNAEFHKELFVRIPQFYFMGALDSNDAVPFDDAYSEFEREKIQQLLGKEMLPDRWQNCKNIYMDNKVNAVIVTFENVGHEQPEMIKKEVLEFFNRAVQTSERQ